MNKQSFLDLLARYESGNCTEAEKHSVDQWYDLLGDQNMQSLSDATLQNMQDRVWSKLNPQSLTSSKNQNVYKLWIRIAVAASVVIAFLMSGLYLFSNHSQSTFIKENNGLELLTVINQESKPITLTLNDQTEVILEPKSEIIYAKAFAANKRSVYLKGNAFFSVSKNPKRPFYVYNQNLVVRVLGTSFFVKEATEHEIAEVAVRTGKVLVNENTAGEFIKSDPRDIAKPVLLTPNQRGLFKSHQLKSTLVEHPLPLSVAYHQPDLINYRFSEAKLKSVFETLSHAYGIEIKAEDNKILDYTFTGDLSNKGLYDQLGLICGSISGKYILSGTSILISIKN